MTAMPRHEKSGSITVDHPYSWPVECSNDREKLGQLQLVVDQEQ